MSSGFDLDAALQDPQLFKNLLALAAKRKTNWWFLRDVFSHPQGKRFAELTLSPSDIDKYKQMAMQAHAESDDLPIMPPKPAPIPSMVRPLSSQRGRPSVPVSSSSRPPSAASSRPPSAALSRPPSVSSSISLHRRPLKLCEMAADAIVHHHNQDKNPPSSARSPSPPVAAHSHSHSHAHPHPSGLSQSHNPLYTSSQLIQSYDPLKGRPQSRPNSALLASLSLKRPHSASATSTMRRSGSPTGRSSPDRRSSSGKPSVESIFQGAQSHLVVIRRHLQAFDMSSLGEDPMMNQSFVEKMLSNADSRNAQRKEIADEFGMSENGQEKEKDEDGANGANRKGDGEDDDDDSDFGSDDSEPEEFDPNDPFGLDPRFSFRKKGANGEDSAEAASNDEAEGDGRIGGRLTGWESFLNELSALQQAISAFDKSFTSLMGTNNNNSSTPPVGLSTPVPRIMSVFSSALASLTPSKQQQQQQSSEAAAPSALFPSPSPSATGRKSIAFSPISPITSPTAATPSSFLSKLTRKMSLPSSGFTSPDAPVSEQTTPSGFSRSSSMFSKLFKSRIPDTKALLTAPENTILDQSTRWVSRMKLQISSMNQSSLSSIQEMIKRAQDEKEFISKQLEDTRRQVELMKKAEDERRAADDDFGDGASSASSSAPGSARIGTSALLSAASKSLSGSSKKGGKGTKKKGGSSGSSSSMVDKGVQTGEGGSGSDGKKGAGKGGKNGEDLNEEEAARRIQNAYRKSKDGSGAAGGGAGGKGSARGGAGVVSGGNTRRLKANNARLLEVWDKASPDAKKARAWPWLVKSIATFLRCKIVADQNDDRDGRRRTTCPEYVFEHLRQSYGAKAIVDDNVCKLLASLFKYETKDSLVYLFFAFLKEEWNSKLLTIYLYGMQFLFCSLYKSKDVAQLFSNPNLDICNNPIMMTAENVRELLLEIRAAGFLDEQEEDSIFQAVASIMFTHKFARGDYKNGDEPISRCDQDPETGQPRISHADFLWLVVEEASKRPRFAGHPSSLTPRIGNS